MENKFIHNKEKKYFKDENLDMMFFYDKLKSDNIYYNLYANNNLYIGCISKKSVIKEV